MARPDEVITDLVGQYGEELRGEDVVRTPRAAPVFTLPPGETFVALGSAGSETYVLSTTRCWYIHPERGLVPCEIVSDAEAAAYIEGRPEVYEPAHEKPLY